MAETERIKERLLLAFMNVLSERFHHLLCGVHSGQPLWKQFHSN